MSEITEKETVNNEREFEIYTKTDPTLNSYFRGYLLPHDQETEILYIK